MSTTAQSILFYETGLFINSEGRKEDFIESEANELNLLGGKFSFKRVWIMGVDYAYVFFK